METMKLYYEDCECAVFTARVMGCEEAPEGWAVTLEATAFYPGGGGQACDTGTLGGVRVLEVREKEDRILHLCSGPLAVGEQVGGRIDWEKRFDLMQQHTGEHILSGLIFRELGLHNVGFHMGAELVEVDFDGIIPPEILERLEAEANRIIWEDRQVRCWYPPEEALPGIPYRSKRALDWPVRIVEVPGADICACCGTHTKSTAQVGLLKVFDQTKLRGGTRLEMACGARALGLLNKIYGQNRQVSQLFSAKPMETADAARRAADQLAGEKYRAAELEKRLLRLTAREYAGRENVLLFEKGLSPAAVRELAQAISEACTGVAAVLSGEDGRYDVCLARPGGDVKALGAEMAKALNGRGGGRPGFFQGSLSTDRQAVTAFFSQREDWTIFG